MVSRKVFLKSKLENFNRVDMGSEKWFRGRLVLMGDAAHALFPGTGMGANQGMLDGMRLASAIDKACTEDGAPRKLYDIAEALEEEYYEPRKKCAWQSGPLLRDTVITCCLQAPGMWWVRNMLCRWFPVTNQWRGLLVLLVRNLI